MSRWRAIYLVARREILERGRSRAFLISLALTVVFLAAGIFLPTILGGDEADKLGHRRRAAGRRSRPALQAVGDPGRHRGRRRAGPGRGDRRSRGSRTDRSTRCSSSRRTAGTPEFVVKERGNRTLGQAVRRPRPTSRS